MAILIRRQEAALLYETLLLACFTKWYDFAEIERSRDSVTRQEAEGSPDEKVFNLAENWLYKCWLDDSDRQKLAT
ncbi:MAG: hypothetical protein RMY30_007520 [Nostoc sp. CmiSLP01]|nr:hypothetical protein [Nostoc sp. CmiSLP01]MDZ8285319.1 hypothetical protein [Nostoc sp. ChiSLP01]